MIASIRCESPNRCAGSAGRSTFDDVWLEARRCPDSVGVDLTVSVRDAWSTEPSARFASSSSTIGINESNLLGTGREASVYLRQDESRIGAGLMLHDPWVRGTNVSSTLRLEDFRDGQEIRWNTQLRRLSVFDPWQMESVVARSLRRGVRPNGDLFERRHANVLVGRLVHATSTSATSVLIGAEGERIDLLADTAARLVGPDSVDRRFIGGDIGLRRETAAYDTLTWLLPRNTLVDIPVGFETEAVVGMGQDLVTRHPLAHVDVWSGRIWMLGHNHFLETDLSTSGYVGNGRIEAGSLRGTTTLFSRATRGVWLAQMAAQMLSDPDPDVRTLATTDLTLRSMDDVRRFARTALAGFLERDVRLHDAGRAYSVDAAVFTAGSMRWGLAASDTARVYVASVGAGLRLSPARNGRGTFRLDVGYPVLYRGIRQRPYVNLSILPWLGAQRSRDGKNAR